MYRIRYSVDPNIFVMDWCPRISRMFARKYRSWMQFGVFVITVLLTALSWKWYLSVAEMARCIPSSDRHRLAVIVPFRDRFDELMAFVPHLSRFLMEQNIDFRIYVINQKDANRFNRASLMNVGYELSKRTCDYMVLHDVDLLPLNAEVSYRWSDRLPVHLSPPTQHPKYHYSKFLGGILALTHDQFRRANGMSNLFWGWGREDDEFRLRLKTSEIDVSLLAGVHTGMNDTFLHPADAAHKRDTVRIGIQQKQQFRRDRLTGLDTLIYNVTSTRQVVVDCWACTVYNVELHCDEVKTPYCRFDVDASIRQKPLGDE